MIVDLRTAAQVHSLFEPANKANTDWRTDVGGALPKRCTPKGYRGFASHPHRLCLSASPLLEPFPGIRAVQFAKRTCSRLFARNHVSKAQIRHKWHKSGPSPPALTALGG